MDASTATQAGPHFALWSPAPQLLGLSLWGAPNPLEIGELGAALVARRAPYRALIDTLRLDSIAPETLEALVGFARRHRAHLRDGMAQVALARPAGHLGTIAAHFLEILRDPHPVETFTELEAAALWLGAPLGWARQLEAERDRALGLNPLLARMREIFGQLGPQPVPSAEVARRLALSQRTLVRRLAELNTSFHRELRQYRVEAAMKLMRETDAPLGAIAVEAGFGSLQRLCTTFRGVKGETPAAWRAKLPKARSVA